MRRVVLMLPLLVSACAPLTPDYRRPDNAVANRIDATGAFQATGQTSPGVPLDRWWTDYNDPALTEAVTDALHANTDVRAALATLARASANFDRVRDARLPQLGLQAEAAYARDSAEEQLTAGPLPNERIYALGASVSYQVDLFGQVSRSIESAGANRDAAVAAVAATRATVAAETVRAYLDVCAAGRELAVALQAVSIATSQTQLARRRTTGGRSAVLDVTRASSQEAESRAALPPLEARKRAALYRLATLTGTPPAGYRAQVEQCVQEPVPAHPIPVGDGATLLKRRPDVVMAEALLHARTADLGVVTANLYPRVSLGVSSASVGLMSHFMDDDTYKFSLGPLITWQFPNRRRAEADIRGSEASIDEALARFDGVVLDALREVETILDGYARDIDQLHALRTAQRSAIRAQAEAQALFDGGREDYLAVLDAERTRVGADQQVAAQQTVIAHDQVTLYLALGGGWTIP